MENKKGQGVFLGVVAVATLIVAIIGATFAYFSASVTSDNTIDVKAYEFSVGMSIDLVAPATETGLIPVAETLLDSALTGYTGKGACVDKNDKQVCQIYKVTLTNNGSSAVTLSTATIATISNGFVYDDETTTNLKAVFLGTNTTATTPTTHGSYTSVLLPVSSDATAATLPSASVTVAKSESGTAGTAYLYFAVYLEDPASSTDQSEFMSDTYSGTLTLTTADGSRITGTFS